jgi:hypothetical protein
MRLLPYRALFGLFLMGPAAPVSDGNSYANDAVVCKGVDGAGNARMKSTPLWPEVVAVRRETCFGSQ